MKRRTFIHALAGTALAVGMGLAGSGASFAASKEIVYLTPGLDLPFWEGLVTGLPKDYMAGGYVAVPEAPGLGIDINLDAIEAGLRTPGTMFLPTDEWNTPKLGFWRPDDRWPE